MKAVNLLPREILVQREPRRINPLVVGGVVLVLAVAAAVGGGFVLERSHVRSEQRQLETAQAAVAHAQAEQPKPGQTRKVLSSPEALAQKEPWQQAIESVLATRVPWDTTLARLARVVPASVSLSSLTLTGAPVPSSPGSLSLAGKASSQLGVAQLYSRLTLLPELDQVKLGPTSTDPTDGSVSFTMQADVNGPATAASTMVAAALTAPTDTSTTSTTTGGSS